MAKSHRFQNSIDHGDPVGFFDGWPFDENQSRFQVRFVIVRIIPTFVGGGQIETFVEQTRFERVNFILRELVIHRGGGVGVHGVMCFSLDVAQMYKRVHQKTKHR